PPHASWRFLAGLLAAATLAAALFVLILVTDRGELVIDCLAPDAQVTVKSGDKAVREMQLRQGKNETTLRAGTYEVVVTGANADQLKVQEGNFTLARRHTAVVKMDRGPPAPDKEAQAANFDPTRRAADWVLKLGGALEVSVDGLPPWQVKAAADLPPKGFRVTRINLFNNPQVTGAG